MLLETMCSPWGKTVMEKFQNLVNIAKPKEELRVLKHSKKSSSKTKKRSSESGKVVFMGVMNDVKTNLLVLSKQGYIVKMSLADMKISRSTNAVGEKVIEIREDDRICSVSIVPNLHQ